jgi:hypothetical protein
MSFSHLLVQKCNIYRRTLATDQYGHRTQTFPSSPLYADVPCRYEKIGNYTSTLAQTPTGQTFRNEGMLFFEKDVDVLAGDRVVLDGVAFTVTPSLPVFDGVGMHHKEVYVSIEEL